MSSNLRTFLKSILQRTSKNNKRENKDNQTDDDKLNSPSEIDQKEIVKNLNGRTLMVYFVLLNKKKTGVRELQRNLDLSSPSVARYHLDKLTDLHLVANKNGVYHLIKKADIPALTSWVLIGNSIIPRILFASIFFSAVFIGYLIFFFTIFAKDSFFVIFISSSIIIYLWTEVWLQYRRKPF